MCLKLNDCEFKASRYNYELATYEPHGNHKAKTYNRYTTTKNIGTQAYYKRISSNHNGRNKKKKSTEEKVQNNWETSNKMALSTYLSINYSKYQWINALIKRHRIADWLKKKKTRPFNMLPTRDSLQGKRHTQTESKGIEKDISCKWK